MVPSGSVEVAAWKVTASSGSGTVGVYENAGLGAALIVTVFEVLAVAPRSSVTVSVTSWLPLLENDFVTVSPVASAAPLPSKSYP